MLKLSKKLGISKIETTKTLNTILECIGDSLKTSDKLKFVRFGTFNIKKMKERTITTPVGIKVKVKAKKKIMFVAGKGLKDVVNSK